MRIKFLRVGKVWETYIEVLARGALDGSSGSFGGAHGCSFRGLYEYAHAVISSQHAAKGGEPKKKMLAKLEGNPITAHKNSV